MDKQPSLFGLLKPYQGLVIGLISLAIGANLLNLLLPKIIARGIDAYALGAFQLNTTLWEFGTLAVLILILMILQTLAQTVASERVARDLRKSVANKIAGQSFSYVEEMSSAKLLTNLTSDIDSIKTFVSQAIPSIISSLVLIIGASTLLLISDWKLALIVLTIIPMIAVTYFLVLKQVRELFKKGREIIDWLNKVINESILGAALIRVLNSQAPEHTKFTAANTEARNTGLKILRLFSILIPVITFFANFATLAILVFGGKFVINGDMTLGDFAAFNSYILILIFPILIIGFMSNIIAQAGASYARVGQVLAAKEEELNGTVTDPLSGKIEVKNVTKIYGEKTVLNDASFLIQPKSRTAIIGPTAAGKSQLLYTLVGLLKPTSGAVTFDGHALSDFDQTKLYSQIGFVFQDSSVFNLSLRENIAFSPGATDADLAKALETAELTDFVKNLPEGLNTVVSERGTSLSGGQKQRLMLARALAANPKILLLDDFTARVDQNTEQKILSNIRKNYPDLTLISVTQKISPITDYDQIILLMEGEVLATGMHTELLESSPEYVQIFNSQQSTNQL